MAFEFKRTRIDKIPREALLAELERVAEHQEFVEFGERDFDREARVGSSTVVRTFGAWSKAMEALRGRLRRRGVEHRARGGPAAAGSPESATSRQKSKLRPARPEARRRFQRGSGRPSTEGYERDRFRCACSAADRPSRS